MDGMSNLVEKKPIQDGRLIGVVGHPDTLFSNCLTKTLDIHSCRLLQPRCLFLLSTCRLFDDLNLRFRQAVDFVDQLIDLPVGRINRVFRPVESALVHRDVGRQDNILEQLKGHHRFSVRLYDTASIVRACAISRGPMGRT